MPELRKKDFAAYFQAVHGSAPFPWQQRLLDQVVEERRWPATLDIPTGCGKTAVLDVALFHLALEAKRAERSAHVRMALVVDRRTVVDQTSTRGAKIQAALEGASSGVLGHVKDALVALSGDPRRPLHLAVLRGGIARDESWARRPATPTLIVSTVDQVGSRLLFRGYGVSDSMKPVHAGLLGNDTILFLDEVHLSQPFAETLEALDERYATWAERPLPRRWQAVQMSATSRPGSRGVFRLDEEDRAHPVVRQRLTASKPTRLVEVKVRGEESDAQRELVTACRKEAEALVAPGRAIGVVVNRVAAARRLFDSLKESVGTRADVYLITGRMRPLDRQDLDAELLPKIRAGRDPDPTGPCTVVVSTQTIEAGADFDFDGLVTECASLDALRQRFGRLNRLGQKPECAGVVLARSDCVKDPDAIYGAAYGNTWRFLKGFGSVDFGIQTLKLPPKDELKALIPEERPAPVLLPAHLDSWVQTRPIPEPDPDVSLWLHGSEQGEPEVQLVWRADLSPQLLDSGNEDAVRDAIDRVEACPPSSPEALSVPLSAARRWLRGAKEDLASADVEASHGEAELERNRDDDSTSRPAFAWRGEDSKLIDFRGIRPGDTLVVPSAYGGIADRNWAPGATALVTDLGDRAFGISKGRGSLRTHPEVLKQIRPASVTSPPPSPPAADEEARTRREDRELLVAWMEAETWGGEGVPDWIEKTVRELLRERARFDLVRIAPAGDAPGYFALQTKKRLRDGAHVTTEDDAASFSGAEVPLKQHLAGVASYAKTFATAAGLPREIAQDVELAAAWHDAGKVDPRFQLMLHGGSRFSTETAPEPLAKSSISARDRERRAEARRKSGYPIGGRHELLSVRLMENAAWLRTKANDWELVLHLVSSHHGWCRPLAPVVVDDGSLTASLVSPEGETTAACRTGLESLDSGVTSRFWRLVRRYGWHGLAWMEAVVRLADHRWSEDEQKEDRP